jgi:5'-nucleotidase
MALSFAETLVVGISSRALFDLTYEDKIFREEGVVAFRQYQKDKETVILKPGTAFHLIKALLKLNELAEVRLVEVIVMSRNSPETGLRLLHSIQAYSLDITRSAFTGGESLHPYIEAFDVDLFLSKDEADVQKVIDSGTSAAAIVYDPPADYEADQSTVRIAFDADAVIFSDESEQIYKKDGLSAFHKNEKENEIVPLKDGPHAKLLKMLSIIQKKMTTGVELSPLRIAIVTARNSPSHLRVIETLRNWDVYIDEAFFLGGISKDKVLQAFRAHIFFDDQETHLEAASRVVPSGRVPYLSNSPLYVPPPNLQAIKPEVRILTEIKIF